MSSSRDAAFHRDDLPEKRTADQHEGSAASKHTSEPAAVRLNLLGDFTVSRGHLIIDSAEWRRRKAGYLVKLLALSPRHQLHRDQILDLLWPELHLEAATNNLRVTLHWARRLLHSRLGISDLVLMNDEILVLAHQSDLWIDIDAFESAAATALESDNPVLYEQAIRLYAGDLLPDDRYEDWVLTRREDLREKYLDLLVKLAGLYEERGEFERAARCLRQVISTDPAREQAHAALMRTLARGGNRQAALHQFELLSAALEDNLGIRPDASSRELFEAILADRVPGTPETVISLSSHRSHAGANRPIREVPRHNLTTSLTSFIGRDQEMSELRAWVRDSRLVTLVGPGGSGKTRLALQLCESLLNDYRDGVWLVELASVIDPDLIVPSICSVLSIREDLRGGLLERLIENLQTSELLLLLDNCEHLVRPTAELVEELLRTCPDVKILCTSRESLGVPGEVAWPVPPLGLPDPAKPLSLRHLHTSEAVALFVERAATRRPGIALTEEKIADVVEICHRLEGQPLAIELAAARVGALSVRQIADRLDNALGLLSTGSRTSPWRHQALRATLDWSYQLLDELERTLFCRLSVFVGGFTLEAAEDVCGDDDQSSEQLLDLVSQLIEKSLITSEDSGDRARYRMLQTIREYAAERLTQAGELELIRIRFRDWYLGLAQRAERELVGTSPKMWMTRLSPEIDNVRAVLHRCVQTSDHETVLCLAGSLWEFWLLSGRIIEGRGWLETSLSDPAVEDVPELVRARALQAAGFLAQRQGDYWQAIEWTEECLARSRAIGDQRGINYALNNLCLCTLSQGDVDRATELARENLELSRVTGIRPAVPTSLSSLGLAEYWRGNLDSARHYLNDAVDAAWEIGFAAFASWLLGQLADVAREQGDQLSARSYAVECIDVGRAEGDEYGPALGGRVLGRLAISEGDYREAAELIVDSLTTFHLMGYKLRAIECLEDIAELAAIQSDLERAIHLLGAAGRLRERAGCPAPPIRRQSLDALFATVRTELVEYTFDDMFAAGRKFTLDQAVECALAIDSR